MRVQLVKRGLFVELLQGKFILTFWQVLYNSPCRTCDDPSPAFFRNGWIPTDVLTWPICRADSNENASEPHLTCEITSRPCCFGIQANCIISTREQCDFLQGRFHQDAFLCSQVPLSFSTVYEHMIRVYRWTVWMRYVACYPFGNSINQIKSIDCG